MLTVTANQPTNKTRGVRNASDLCAHDAMLPLRLATQSYAWGVPASLPSKVRELARANGVEDAISPNQPDEPMAELWVGTHPSGGAVVRTLTPAAVAKGSLSLEGWLEQHAEALGAVLAATRAAGTPTGRLPFLMKVLSISKALPLQAHPTTSSAGSMHAAHPDLYPDANHKPEMVVALDDGFCGFAGFLGPDPMAALLRGCPQLQQVLGADHVREYLAACEGGDDQSQRRRQALAAMWEQLLLRTPTDTAAQVCRAVLASMQHDVQAPHHAPGQAPPSGAQRTGTTTSSGAHQGSLEAQQAATAAALSGPDHVANACDLALALSVLGARPGALSQRYAMLSAAASAWPAHPVGVLALMLLEDAVLGPGEAVTIPSGCPHAYICGEVLEVQAASNNTIKGGLTAEGEPTDKRGLVHAATGGLRGSAGQGQHAAAGDSAASGSSANSIHEGGPRTVQPAVLPRPGAAPAASAAAGGEGGADWLRLYQPDVDEFQVLHCCVHAGGKVELVVDPGPAVLLVLGGSGRALLRAVAVSDALVLDEAELKPGTALFIAAGSSVSISGSDTTRALDAWITTANNRMFTAAAAPAGEAEGVSSAGRHDIVMPDAAGRAGAALAGGDVDPGTTFTAAEQVAAGISMGGAGSSCPANAADAASAAGAGGTVAMQTG